MILNEFAEDLERRIEREYKACGYSLGWRLLYSPLHVLDGARVAFLAMNPGGNIERPDHAEFAMEAGSAYRDEHWKRSGGPGTSKLQRQVLALFKKLGEKPEDVLSGNLVPFRSPDWDNLVERDRAVAFGKNIWKEIFTRANPSLVIGAGTPVREALIEILDVEITDEIPVNWGTLMGHRGQFAGGIYVGIPHLSRFGIMTRPSSEDGVKRLFA